MQRLHSTSRILLSALRERTFRPARAEGGGRSCRMSTGKENGGGANETSGIMAENGQHLKAEGSEPGPGLTEIGRHIRLLFCGDKYFPSAFFFTRDYLKQYPHILVETLPIDEIESVIHEYDMCVSKNYQLNANVLSLAKKLKVITQFGMGLEGVDVEAATQLGIRVARIPSVTTGNALSCAEHAIYLMLSLLRNQRHHVTKQREKNMKLKRDLINNGRGLKGMGVNITSYNSAAILKGMEKSVLKRHLGEPLTKTLFNTTVCIVGYGGIGKELAPRLKPFGVRVLAVRPSWNQKFPLEESEENEKSFTETNGDEDGAVDRKGGMEHLHEFISQADIVVMCCSLTPKTRGMVNEEFLASMRKGAFLVNVARGGLMDYDAVTGALNSGHLGGLGTDVTWVEPVDPHDPMLQHPNVVITPHVAGVTELSYRTMGQVIATSALQLSEGRPVTGLEFVN